MKTIEFTDGEISALLQLIDIAIKAGGLNVAQAGATLAAKVSGQPTGPQEVESSPMFAEPAELENAPEEEAD
jgi:hypothetical protein|tara:strand:+ start:160 stop:375 length:216 start_codon:yes stop_codon:yes gene_type:complete